MQALQHMQLTETDRAQVCDKSCAMHLQIIPTPLTRLRWWRVCLDEAQMVEGSGPATAMAGRLQAVHRWAVTGTPMSQDARDLLGLLRFLQAPEPWLREWNNLCQGALLASASTREPSCSCSRMSLGGPPEY